MDELVELVGAPPLERELGPRLAGRAEGHVVPLAPQVGCEGAMLGGVVGQDDQGARAAGRRAGGGERQRRKRQAEHQGQQEDTLYGAAVHRG